jgi:hypothetical protein
MRRDGTPKTAYMSRGEALSVAEEWSRENGLRLDAYACTVCSAWHLGNPLESDD